MIPVDPSAIPPGPAPDELACREFVDQLAGYLDEALSPSERARIEAHAAACAGCDGFLDQMLRTVELVAGLARREDLGAQLVASLRARYDAWAASEPEALDRPLGEPAADRE